ncbi:MAG: AAA family ATPase, partial [Anaerolineae bacterium]|nr:AAA family ATPase [Anaerolineae bacterium]
IDILSTHPEIHYRQLENGDLLVTGIDTPLVEKSRLHRWPAWAATEAADAVVEKVKQFIDPLILEQENSGLGSIAGELRYATPVFLKFAGLDYNNDPQAREQLDSFVRDVQNILKETRGRLVSLEVADKGSVLFAVFGAPVAYGDDSQRAIHAALSFRELPSVHPAIHSQSIGISRGLLYSGTVGGEVRHEYTSLGDETNVASRLMSADKNGDILVSEAAYEDCSDWFDFKSGEIVYPKGRVGQIQTYIPIRVTRRFRRSLRKSPIVGREKELDIIQKALEALQEAKPRILRIEGEPGIGKSRLAAELTYLAEHSGLRVATGFCLSTGKSVAFLPWRPVIRAITGVQDEWNDTMEIAHLEKWLPAQKPEWALWLPLLGDLLELAIPDNPTTRNLIGNARQQALFALVIDLLYHAAPLTLIIEDTHWLDEVSEALLIEMASRLLIEPAGILMTLLHRPAEESEHPTAILKALNEMYIHRHLLLNELSQQKVGQLLEGRLRGRIPSELTDFVYQKSLGNPFFVQEVVDVLQEANIITRVGPQVYIDASLESSDLPQTVQGLIQARIDHLSETEKLVLKLAAVIGRQFEVRVLYQSLPVGMTPETVMQHLRTLEKRKFTQLDALHPEPLYSFRHAITQEVTYQTLLHDQRQQWHRTVGSVLENLAPHSVERLAYHFSHSDDRERAFVYLVKAGDKSAYEFANLSALDYWGKALKLARTPKEAFDLLCKRLELLIRIGDRETTTADFENLLKLAESAPT